MTKVVVATKHLGESADERAWAIQWAGLDPDLYGQFPTVIDWQDRARKVCWISKLDWDGIVDAISYAAMFVSAGRRGGVVLVATGHAGLEQRLHSFDPAIGLISFDPRHFDILSWDDPLTPDRIGSGLFWDQNIVRYLDPRPDPHEPRNTTTLKDLDDDAIKQKTQGWQLKKKRHDAYDALYNIGVWLLRNRVTRLTFLTCRVGRSNSFMDRVAAYCRAEVAAFKYFSAVYGDNTGKARLILLEDDKKTRVSKTDVPLARVESPNLDDATLAYVAGKKK